MSGASVAAAMASLVIERQRKGLQEDCEDYGVEDWPCNLSLTRRECLLFVLFVTLIVAIFWSI